MPAPRPQPLLGDIDLDVLLARITALLDDVDLDVDVLLNRITVLLGDIDLDVLLARYNAYVAATFRCDPDRACAGGRQHAARVLQLQLAIAIEHALTALRQLRELEPDPVASAADSGGANTAAEP